MSVKKIHIWIVLLLLLAFAPGVIVYVEAPKPVSPYLTEMNQGLTIDNTGKTGYIVKEHPLHGTVPANRTTLRYVPNLNYTGTDSFIYTANGTTGSRTVSIIVNPPNSKLVFVAPPEYRAELAFSISLGIVFSIFVIAYFVISRIRMRQTKEIERRFWDIIRDENWYPSLAIFQFLLWTGVVLLSYMGIALTRFFSGVLPLADLPGSLILVMGISAAVPLTGAVVSSFQYAGATPTSVETTKEVPSDIIRKRLPGFKTMLMENDKITLPRFQMFAWTWIGIIAYLGLLFLEVNGKIVPGSFINLIVPSLPILFISLMGLSQVTYLTAKGVRSSFVSINEVRPASLQLQKKGNFITILGSNFGKARSTVWVEYYPPLKAGEDSHITINDKEKEKMKNKGENVDAYENYLKEEYRYSSTRPVKPEQFKATFSPEDKDISPHEEWSDSRIVVSLDSIKDKLISEEYVVRVEKEGLLTYATSDAVFEVQEDQKALECIHVNPINGSVGVKIDSQVTATFSAPVRSTTIISGDTFSVKDDKGNPVQGGITSTDNCTTIVFTPVPTFEQNNRYTVTIKKSIMDISGASMATDMEWHFTTAV